MNQNKGDAAVCFYSLGLGRSKKINCGLLRFARSDRLQMRHCEPLLCEWQEAFESQKGGAAVCLIFIVLGTSKKINCGLLRFARNDRLQMRHCEPPLKGWQELLNHMRGRGSLHLVSCLDRM